jgi:hypothetical protein
VIYSVYNPDTHQYAYYRGPGPSGTHAGSPKPRGKTELGSAPDDAAWKLPVAAVPIGSGSLPRGRIASTRSTMFSGALGGLGDWDATTVGIWAGVAYLAWRFLR